MESLKKMSISNCIVIRDGIDREVPTTELVPGDVVKLEEGLNVPADIRLLEVNQCKIDESALTGESVPITKSVESLPENTLLADGKHGLHGYYSIYWSRFGYCCRNWYEH